MKLPIYARPETGIYCLHLSIAGNQVKRTLRTRDKSLAILRALEHYKALGMATDPHKFEIDLARGIFKTDGTPEDNKAMLVALEVLNRLGLTQQQFLSLTEQQRASALAETPIVEKQPKGLKLSELYSKFLSFKKFQTATIKKYTFDFNEFRDFLKDSSVVYVNDDDITRFIEHLKSENNTLRTIDNKIATIRAVFNFAIKQKYFFGDNPAKDRSLLTKKDKVKQQWAIFFPEEIQLIFDRARMLLHKEKDPDFYFVLMLGLITGCRVNELTTLKKDQFIKHEQGFTFIRLLDSKTIAGIREIPLPDSLVPELSLYLENRDLPDNKAFKYLERDGKGSGNAVGKKFSYYLQELKITRPKLVFHSLRKFFNNYMKEQGITLEMRSQVIGHEVEGTNSELYSKQFPLVEVQRTIADIQNKVLNLVKYQ